MNLEKTKRWEWWTTCRFPQCFE